MAPPFPCGGVWPPAEKKILKFGPPPELGKPRLFFWVCGGEKKNFARKLPGVFGGGGLGCTGLNSPPWTRPPQTKPRPNRGFWVFLPGFPKKKWARVVFFLFVFFCFFCFGNKTPRRGSPPFKQTALKLWKILGGPTNPPPGGVLGGPPKVLAKRGPWGPPFVELGKGSVPICGGYKNLPRGPPRAKEKNSWFSPRKNSGWFVFFLFCVF